MAPAARLEPSAITRSMARRLAQALQRLVRSERPRPGCSIIARRQQPGKTCRRRTRRPGAMCPSRRPAPAPTRSTVRRTGPRCGSGCSQPRVPRLPARPRHKGRPARNGTSATLPRKRRTRSTRSCCGQRAGFGPDFDEQLRVDLADGPAKERRLCRLGGVSIERRGTAPSTRQVGQEAGDCGVFGHGHLPTSKGI